MPRYIRLLARLDLKGDSVIKGFQMEGLRKIGEPLDLIKKYVHDGVDEIFLFDAVASLYKREAMYKLIEQLAESHMIPITVSGGIRDIEHARKIFHAGADRVGINTGAFTNPKLIKEVADEFGAQAVVLSLEVKKNGTVWRIYGDGGRNDLGFDLEEWLEKVQMDCIGEILVTCVDSDGTLEGFPKDILHQLLSCQKPFIVSGGISTEKEVLEIAASFDLSSGVAIGLAFHENQLSIPRLKEALSRNLVNVRT
jgi:cyclase